MFPPTGQARPRSVPRTTLGPAAPDTKGPPTMLPSPPPRALPVGVGIAALADDTRAVWALVTSEGLNLTGEVTPAEDLAPGTGAAVFAAIEQMLAHPSLQGRSVTLFLAHFEHREQVADLAAALGPITVHAVTGGLGKVARTLVAETFPDLAPEPEPEVAAPPAPKRRLRIGTDGSVGFGHRGVRGGGWAWVSEDGRFGVDADKSGVRHPLCAEIRAINLALRSLPKSQPLHIFCDSKRAITAARMMADPERRAVTGYRFPSPLNKYEIGALTQVIEGRDVVFSWIPSHRDADEVSHSRQVAWALNDAADRLAVSTRRGAQFDMTEEVLAATHESIVEELTERLVPLREREDVQAPVSR